MRRPDFNDCCVGSMLTYGAIMIALSLMVGCSQNASTVSSSDAQAAVDKLTYAKDARTNTCYAIIASRGTGEVHQNGLTITYVPCTPAVEAEIAREK